MDISKLRSKIREAREAKRRQRRASAEESSDDAKGCEETAPDAVLSASAGTAAASMPPVPEKNPVIDDSAQGHERIGHEAATESVRSEAASTAEKQTVPVELPEDSTPADRISLLVFDLAGQEYAVRMTNLKEVQTELPVTRVPRTPSFILGIISLRGKVVPLMDLRKRLGIEGPAPDSTRVLIFSRNGDLFGLRVDSVRGVLRVEPAAFLPEKAPDRDSAFISGAVGTEGRTLLLLDLDEIFTFKEAV